MAQRGRPKKKEDELREYQRVAILKSTYNRASFNASKRDVSLLSYIDDIVPKERGYKENVE